MCIPYKSPAGCPLLLSLLAALSACNPMGEDPFSPPPEPHEDLVEPWGIELPPAPDPGFEIRTEVFYVPSGAERMFCTFGTFKEELAVQTYEWFHHGTFGHHMVIKGLSSDSAESFPDGSVWDCLPNEFYQNPGLGPQAALFNGTHPGLIRGRMQLADGDAVMIGAGTRYMIQSHYINVTERDVYLQDILHFGTVAVEEVERPVGAWTFTSSDFEVAPGESAEVSSSCVFESEAYMSLVMVHMHTFATHFTSSLILPNGTEVPSFWDEGKWYDGWRYGYPNQMFEPGLHIPEGASVKYTCHFHNSGDIPLTWPLEMCVFEGLAYPLERPMICNNGIIFPPFRR